MGVSFQVQRAAVLVAVCGAVATSPVSGALQSAAALRRAALTRLSEYRNRPGIVGTLALERLARAGDASAGEQLRLQAGTATGSDAVAALLRLGDRAQASRAEQFLADRALAAPETLFNALVQTKITSAGASIDRWLDASDDQTIAAAALALGRLGHATATPRLRELQTGANPLIRPAAAAALWRLGDRSVAPALDEALRNMLPEVRLFAAAAWAPESDGPWRSVVEQLLTDPHPPRRIAAGRLLVQLAPARVRTVLGRDATSLADPALRAEAAAVFEQVATAADAPTLADALHNDDVEVQVHAAGAIVRVIE